jgi:hypothetical protein
MSTQSNTSPSSEAAPQTLSIAQELELARKKVAELEKKQQQEQYQRLFGLAKEVGYADTNELVKALMQFCDGISLVDEGGLPVKIEEIAPVKPAGSTKPSTEGGVKRPRVSEEQKQQIKDLLDNGADTAKAIAEKVGVSMPYVNKMKKDLGLTKERPKKDAGSVAVAAVKGSKK